jgi:hypothetical protein
MALVLNGTDGTVGTPAVTGSTGGTGTGVYYPATNQVALATNGTQAVLVDANQNVGVGVIPSAWFSTYKALQIGAATSLFNDGGTTSRLSNNAIVNASGNFAYISTGAASYYQQSGGQHAWYYAASGTAGTAITFTQAMLLDASSNLTIAGSTATKASGTTWANPSDTRLKNNQALYTKGLTELNQIKVKTWVYNGLGGSLNGQTGIGVIADEAMIVLPDTVDTYSAKLNPTDSEETDIKRFNASEVIWLLVTSLQELDAKFESYKATHP